VQPNVRVVKQRARLPILKVWLNQAKRKTSTTNEAAGRRRSDDCSEDFAAGANFWPWASEYPNRAPQKRRSSCTRRAAASQPAGVVFSRVASRVKASPLAVRLNVPGWRRWPDDQTTSALPPRTDIGDGRCNVGLGPNPDMTTNLGSKEKPPRGGLSNPNLQINWAAVSAILLLPIRRNTSISSRGLGNSTPYRH
jgi:hypothetical protein